ncbi:P-loop containing nucleoside triphosphate hydrolase protein [Pholiota conissans]|uniref:P-loop containing nucleoside triphosphate hydrolase protein n=1 Tax=Pholiota conissans TaxID=109636 RepID=A0A9P6D3F5_9AGAR|nr:P-loop containing nucleoside triphosphate hydrolase protein [Pholiota conissans]
MDVLKSLIQPLVGGAGGSSVVDGMKLVVLGGTVETARRVSSSACEEDFPYDWLMLWLSRRPEWQRSREFETTTRTAGPGGATSSHYSAEDADWDQWEVAESSGLAHDPDSEGRPKTRVVFQPTYDTTHTIFYRGHWLRVRRGRKQETGSEMLSISVVARSNAILKQLVLQAKKEYEAEAVHRIQIYFADAHGSWRWTDSRHKRPMQSIVLNPGVKEMLLDDARDFLKSEKWYADRGIPFRRGYLLHGVPGSGKSSLIHALAGQLQLDIYVVSLSASWISDNTLTALMGRVPARCVLLLEDLDAAFVRSTNREDDPIENDSGGPGDNQNMGLGLDTNAFPSFGGLGGSRRRRYGRSDGLSDMNTLSLSGLLNALDGVAASEGRLLFATTNHLERLDPALSRPGRMDVWVEFKNASKWQAEALFRNFFPCEEEEETITEADFEGLDIDGNLHYEDRDGKVRTYVPSVAAAQSGRVKVESQSTSSVSASGGQENSLSPPSLWSLSTSIASSATSLLSAATSPTATTPSGTISPPLPRTVAGSPIPTDVPMDKDQFGATNTAYLPPPPDPSLTKVKPLDKKTLAALAKKFADGLPDDEFSVAGLQGYLLKHKAQPEAAADGVEAWVKSEREMRERLKREKEAREVREKAQREKRKKEAQEKDKAKKAQDKKDQELERVKALLAEKEKEDELEKMRQQLRDKEAEEKKKKRKESKKKKGKKDAEKEEEKDKKEDEEDKKDKGDKEDKDGEDNDSEDNDSEEDKKSDDGDADAETESKKDDADEEESKASEAAESDEENIPPMPRSVVSSSSLSESSWGDVS